MALAVRKRDRALQAAERKRLADELRQLGEGEIPQELPTP